MRGDEVRVCVTVKNNRLAEAIERAGYASVNAFCVAVGLSPVVVGRLLNFKQSPLKKSGEWCATAARCAEVLFVELEDLFPEALQHLELASNKAHFAAPWPTHLALGSEDPSLALERDEFAAGVQALLQALRPQQRQVLAWRFGLEDGNRKTLQEIGEELNLSGERVLQIEHMGLRNLRRLTRERAEAGEDAL